MIIEVDGYTFRIFVESSSKSIVIGGYRNQMIYLHVPHTFPTAELYAFIRANKRLINSYITNSYSEKQFDNFQIFDRVYTLVIKARTSNPYLLADKIYSSAYPIHENAVKHMQYSLLLQQLTLQISTWEEHLHLLISEIKIRKLKTNYFTVCTRDKRITFSADLIQKSVGFISFICGEAVMCLMNINSQERAHLMDRFVKDWKLHEKNVSYEREYTD
ncbi:M48 family metallopeptidase [Sphingobacterium alkalisoli]|uniref:M48 family metallopeptidase n=1 Tax=Sphingobacterium alkalisoli TaxID=1874115 RepID=A0A4U0H1W2_9SPHI|nr:YgjP-like metallopeptidase domain-containing protein [Sphingobacterium alkalisoli]TJY65563.1 M48 family metallopeptidase [Sphingobacterium alkalisoli]GGH19714.1 hypothetical protein GCM10011418_24350 [Sphingobacterium alkalisoli]